jgi:hypothetical protein
MKRGRKWIAAVVLAALGALPLGGCVGGPGPAIGQLAGLALGVGASVGTYYLVKSLK